MKRLTKKRKSKKEKVKSILSNNYTAYKQEAEILYVLDEDPVIASHCLTKKHLTTHARMIAESLAFQHLLNSKWCLDEKTIKTKYKLKLIPFICSTPYSINFFSLMYTEIVNIYKELTGQYISNNCMFDKDLMLFNTDIAQSKADSNIIEFPDYYSFIKKNKAYAKYNISGISDSLSSIEIQRLMYMIDGYLLSDFPCGAPAWYSPLSREIYRKYDRISKKTFIIQVDEQGKYKYYFQHISNKLREITDINELRELIDSFLYQV